MLLSIVLHSDKDIVLHSFIPNFCCVTVYQGNMSTYRLYLRQGTNSRPKYRYNEKKIKPGELMNLLGLLTQGVSGGLFTGTETAQKIPKPTPTPKTVHGKPETQAN